MLQNARVTAFTISELLSENQQDGGKITLPPTQIRFNTLKNCHLNYKPGIRYNNLFQENVIIKNKL